MKNTRNVSLFSKFYFSILLFLLFGLSSCQFLRPTTFDTDVDFKQATNVEKEKILKALEKSTNSVTSFRYRANLKLSGTLWKTALRFSAVAIAPEQLRVELFTTGFPKLLTLMIVNEPQVLVYDARERVVYGSDDSLAAIENVLGIPQTSEDLMYWSQGLPRPISEPGQKSQILVGKNFQSSGLFSIKTETQDGTWHSLLIFTACESGDVVRELETLFVRDGKAEFKASFEYQEEYCSTAPKRISFTIREHGVDGTLANILVSRNPELSSTADRLFSFESFMSGPVMPLDKHQSQYDHNKNR